MGPNERCQPDPPIARRRSHNRPTWARAIVQRRFGGVNGPVNSARRWPSVGARDAASGRRAGKRIDITVPRLSGGASARIGQVARAQTCGDFNRRLSLRESLPSHNAIHDFILTSKLIDERFAPRIQGLIERRRCPSWSDCASFAERKATFSFAERKATFSFAERKATFPFAERKATFSFAERKATFSFAERKANKCRTYENGPPDARWSVPVRSPLNQRGASLASSMSLRA